MTHITEHFDIYAGAAMMVAWINGIAADAHADRMGWVVADILAPPLGMIRGLGFLFN
jgi:hypothetical protein